MTVALRKESVDRNMLSPLTITRSKMSLSARRAWIEIRQRTHSQPFHSVALRKESVDRNDYGKPRMDREAVALRKESVDRNKSGRINYTKTRGRSPQGERG